MRIFYCDHFVLPLPEGHRFPMVKYRRLRERVETASFEAPSRLEVPDAATDHELGRVHTAAYIRKVVDGTLTRDEVRSIGFPWSPELVERSRRSVGGTVSAARAAHTEGIAANLAGGTHHAFADRGEGFCVFNDAAVAARTLQAEGRVRRVAILDLDVHQGNGSAAIFASDPTVFTLSVHGERNYPFRKERSDLDVELPDGTGDVRYLETVRRSVDLALDRASADLAIFLAGADPFEGDRLGRLAVTREGLTERDRLVFDACERRGLPVAVVMSGGYADDIDALVDIHFATVREAVRRAGGRERS